MGIDLEKLTKDLLTIIRGSIVNQSEPVSIRQIEDWVHQYRALLIRRDLTKGYSLNPDYLQELDNEELEFVDEAEDNSIDSDYYILRTKNQLPKTLDLPLGSGIKYVGTVLGKQIQVVPYSRLHWQKYRKYTGKDETAALRNQRIYIKGSEELEYINIRGIFENPLEVEDSNDTNWYANYPLPQDKVPILKQMILSKELGIISRAPSDTSNDAQFNLSPNVEKQPVSNE